jgi:hypothetical protein
LTTINIKQRVFIDLPTEDIFRYVSDLDNLIDWSSATIAIRKLSPGEIGLGTIVRSTSHFLGRWLDITFEIVEYHPNSYLTIKSISGAAPGLYSYQFEPAKSGGTIVSLEVVLHLTLERADLTEPVVISAIRRQVEYDLLTLKDILEARLPTSKIAD